MVKKYILLLVPMILLGGCFPQLYQRKEANKRKSSPFQQVDFTALMKRYMKRDKPYVIEGIYSVSGSVVKKGKGMLSASEKEKTTDKKENYARVAILRDLEETGSGRDYIEISLDKELQPTYSIVGEFSSTTSSNLLLYKHLGAKNKNTSYTFTNDAKGDILEGVRVENDGSTTITYRLTYVKLHTN